MIHPLSFIASIFLLVDFCSEQFLEGGYNMRKAIAAVILFLIIFTLAGFGAVLAEKTDYSGEWVCVSIDMGDGVKMTEYEGSSVADLMKIQLNQDGSLLVTSFGDAIPGTWQAGEQGITANIDGQVVEFEFRDGQLVNDSNGVISYLEKSVVKSKSGGLLSLIKGSKYVGNWVASAMDEGDGVLKYEIDGFKISDLIALQINRDGTLVMTSMGFRTDGVWHEIEGGINITLDDMQTDVQFLDNQLIANADGATVYFKRIEQTNQASAGSTPPPAKVSVFAGIWKAVRYETMGYTFDIDMLFPEGCTITLREDGTGEAFITSTYTEKITWTDKDGSLTLGGSFVFSSPAWNAEKEELTVFYGSSTVSVIFQKRDDEAAVTTAEPNMFPTYAPTVEVTPAPTAEPVATAEVPVTVTGDTLLCETKLFTVSFPKEGWVNNENWWYDREDYSAVKYELNDSSGAFIASISLTASSEGVDTYRDKMKYLMDYAMEAGKEKLDEIEIGGIAFSGTGYERWGWEYTEYTARVPESRITLAITVEQPEKIGDSLQSILDSISYKLPVLTPPNVDPPLPEDGIPYEPKPSSVSVGTLELTATWIKPDQPIVLDSIFNNQIALEGNRLYVLAGKMLYAYTVGDDALIPDQLFENGVMKLADDFEYLTLAKDGILYVSEGIFNILAIKDGAVIQDNNISGNLVMHPGGEWGISYWANAEPKLIHAKDGVLTEEQWILSNLSDAQNRKGRFSSISCIAISNTRIYVAGSDAEKGEAQRVAVYDLDGKELFTFGAEDWTKDDAFGSVTGIVETSEGILVLDGNYRAFKLFSRQGEFIGTVDGDSLLGTDYPWLSSMIPVDDGVLVAAAQSREDESCDELLIYMIKGF